MVEGTQIRGTSCGRLDSNAPAKRRAIRRSDAEKLRRALMALAEHRAQFLEHRERPWASITFAGARHCLSLLFAGDEAVAAGEAFIDQLPDHEFTIPARLVADAVVREVEHRLHPHPRLVVHCEVLLLEEV